jgi:hypothetical protein
LRLLLQVLVKSYTFLFALPILSSTKKLNHYTSFST